jgi:methionyl aminopeptidase
MISIKTNKEIELMAESGRILAEIMQELKKAVKPGIQTRDLDKLARELVSKFKVEPGFLDYGGYPAVLCTSVNEVIVHQIPSAYTLEEGDILTLDMGVIHQGYYSDMAVTVPVGEVSREASFLIRAVKKSLSIAIKKAKPGNTLGDIGNNIERYLTKRGLNVVKELCGHGIGKELHEPPEVLNFGKRHKGLELQKGMVICIEPMAAIGRAKIKKSADGFGYETIDGSLSSHSEHMIAVLDNGARVLTKL